MVLDEIDRKILDVLQVEGRITNLELAERVGLSSAPCMRRVRALEEAGVIRSYVALMDPALIGLGFDAIVEVRLKQQNRKSFERFEKKVTSLPEVVECSMIAGDWDYSLRVVSSDLARYQSFILDRLMHPAPTSRATAPPSSCERSNRQPGSIPRCSERGPQGLTVRRMGRATCPT